jgi:hypothetical protein
MEQLRGRVLSAERSYGLSFRGDQRRHRCLRPFPPYAGHPQAEHAPFTKDQSHVSFRSQSYVRNTPQSDMRHPQQLLTDPFSVLVLSIVRLAKTPMVFKETDST